ncbi:hypothetical protein ACHQM5_029575 [Ranunculus cassubicifolius]
MAENSALALATIDEDSSSSSKKDSSTKTNKKSRKGGIFSRIFNGIFRSGKDDFEKRLEHISKEEASVLARLKSRSRRWRRIARNLIVLSVIAEVVAVGYAIMTTRSMDLNWKMRAVRVLPMFLLPALSSLTYFVLGNFIKMCDRKDQKTIERLREERQAKINELKERTNYYITQQLIQRYDPDPAAKAAAASVLASKLGADSGLKVYLGDESAFTTPQGKSNDAELSSQAKSLRNRKHTHSRSSSTGNMTMSQSLEEVAGDMGFNGGETLRNETVVVDHHPSSTIHDGGWFARIAALLVGEDPTQSYALICGSCHMHNGLARKEDFPYITYYCPHCRALNRAHIQEEHPPPVSNSTSTASLPESPTEMDAVDTTKKEEKILSSSLKPVSETIPTENKVTDEPIED